MQPEIPFLVNVFFRLSHLFWSSSKCLWRQQKTSKYYASSQRTAFYVPNYQKRRKCNVGKKLFLKPCPLFYREYKFQKMWLPKHLLHKQRSLAGVLLSPLAAKRALCGGGTAGSQTGMITKEGRVPRAGERQWAAWERTECQVLRKPPTIRFVAAVWFTPFQQAN